MTFLASSNTDWISAVAGVVGVVVGGLITAAVSVYSLNKSTGAAVETETRQRTASIEAEGRQREASIEAENRQRTASIEAEGRQREASIKAENRRRNEAVEAEMRQREAAIESELRQREAAIESEHRQQRAASDAAWRLLGIELGNARDAVWQIRKKGAWPVGWNRTWSGAWREFRGPLLMSPRDDDALGLVAKACARIDELENGVNAGRDDDEYTLDGKDQLFLWAMQQVLEPACEALEYCSSETRARRPTKHELTEWEANPGQQTGPLSV